MDCTILRLRLCWMKERCISYATFSFWPRIVSCQSQTHDYTFHVLSSFPSQFWTPKTLQFQKIEIIDDAKANDQTEHEITRVDLNDGSSLYLKTIFITKESASQCASGQCLLYNIIQDLENASNDEISFKSCLLFIIKQLFLQSFLCSLHGHQVFSLTFINTFRRNDHTTLRVGF